MRMEGWALSRLGRRLGVPAGLAIVFELSLGAVAVLVGWLLGHSPLSRVGSSLTQLLWFAALGAAAALPMLLGLLAALACPLEPFARLRRLVAELVPRLFPGAGLLELALVSMAAGIGEELLFRGLVQDGLSRWVGDPFGVWLGLAAASLLFGLAHPVSPLYVFLAMLTGAYLGWLLIVTGSLVTPVVAHATYDLVALVLVSRRLRPHEPPDPREAHDAIHTG
jgi:membrane protease YdiL (CAAX protease family)